MSRNIRVPVEMDAHGVITRFTNLGVTDRTIAKRLGIPKSTIFKRYLKKGTPVGRRFILVLMYESIIDFMRHATVTINDHREICGYTGEVIFDILYRNLKFSLKVVSLKGKVRRTETPEDFFNKNENFFFGMFSCQTFDLDYTDLIMNVVYDMVDREIDALPTYYYDIAGSMKEKGYTIRDETVSKKVWRLTSYKRGIDCVYHKIRDAWGLCNALK